MAQSIRVSDLFYDMAGAASAAAGRSLAQQFEYWAKLGAALDAAGVTSEQVARILGGDEGLKAKVLASLAPGSSGTSRSETGGQIDVSARIAARHAADEAAVKAGKRTPQSLLVIPEEWIKKARFVFPDEPSFGDGW